MYRKIDYDLLSTAYEEDPVVTFRSESGSVGVQVDFASSYIDDTGWGWRTTLTFPRVLDFRYFDFDSGLLEPNPDDGDFALVETEDSEVLAQFAATKGLERRSSTILQLSDLHHYRIAFDDNGAYDAVSTAVEVSYRRVQYRTGNGQQSD